MRERLDEPLSDELLAERRRVAAGHSWDKRADVLLEAILEIRPGRR